MPSHATRISEVKCPYDASVVYKGFRNLRLSQFLGRTTVIVREVDAGVLKPEGCTNSVGDEAAIDAIDNWKLADRGAA